MKPTGCMYISVPGHEDQSTGAGRQTSPDDETDATCLLAGQHSVSHSAGHGDDRAPAYPSDRLHPEQPPSTIAALSDPSCRLGILCLSLLSTRLSPLFVVCVLLGVHAMTKLDAQRVSDLRAHSRAAAQRDSRICRIRQLRLNFRCRFAPLKSVLGASEATGPG
jgi:hypothetical protein